MGVSIRYTSRLAVDERDAFALHPIVVAMVQQRATLLLPLLLLLGLLGTAGCNRPKTYETEVEVKRISVVAADETGKPLTTDFEISYAECPGEQIEVVRGGEEFSACLAQNAIKVGGRVKVKIVHAMSQEGELDAKVHQVGPCTRPPDPNDDASFDMVRDCADWKVNGATVGFQCDYSAQKTLVAKCPWFRKH